MLENYRLAKADAPDSLYSKHWDVFASGYEKIIADEVLWPNFRNNGITDGYEDSYHGLGTRAAAQAENCIHQGKWKSHPAPYTKALKHYRMICSGIDRKWIVRLIDTDIGNPVCYIFDDVKYDLNSLNLAYECWRINPLVAGENQEGQLRLLDIGGGYGGMARMLKLLNPQMRIILLDLPEVTAAQHYYLTRAFPDARLFGYSDWVKGGMDAFFDGQYSFALLPPWCMESVPAASMSMVLNMRSMQEMSRAVIAGYLSQIERVIQVGGIFYCLNRYEKKIGNERIRIKDYPYDGQWECLLSERSLMQPHMHRLICRRAPQASSLSRLDELLLALPPDAPRMPMVTG
jgi:putative sugar O-methyltransferase